MAQPLSGLQVFELSEDLPAAYCAKQFAAWGNVAQRTGMNAEVGTHTSDKKAD